MHRFIVLPRLVVPWYRFRGKWSPKAILVKLLTPLFLIARKMPLFANNIGFAVLKPKLPDDLQPWLKQENGEIVVDTEWVEKEWRNN